MVLTITISYLEWQLMQEQTMTIVLPNPIQLPNIEVFELPIFERVRGIFSCFQLISKTVRNSHLGLLLRRRRGVAS
jgi:hypothetical protein